MPTAGTTKSAAKKAAGKAARDAAAKAPAKQPPAASRSKSAAAHSPADTASNAVDEQLARYRSMRDFHITAEPSGSAQQASPEPDARSRQLPFCIQKHAASHLHYDFRLGWNGVLKSWAVAKGPSYVTADKRLAVQVEDHPIEYGGFEGIIPAGQYGGGTVMLWDQGTWEPQAAYPDVDEGLRKGSLKFILHGSKMQGKWALIRMGGHPSNSSMQRDRERRSSSKPQWLLIKEHDPYERTPTDPAITDEADRSVVTGRTMEEIAASEDHVWNSKETAAASPDAPAWYRQQSKSAPEPPHNGVPRPSSARAGSPATALPTLTALPKESQPDFLSPQLAQQADNPPSAPDWLHELKLDGYRIQARKSGDSAAGQRPQVALLTRKGLDWTHRMPALAAEIARIPAASATLDGEVVVLGPDGNSSFANLQAAFQSPQDKHDAKHHLTYFAFDLLHLNGRNPRKLPLRERKALLGSLLAAADPDTLRLSEHLEGDGVPIFHNACKLHAEGILSKLASSPYCAGRSSTWLKSKCLHEQEFIIGGFSLPGAGHTGMHGIGSLILGYYAGKPAKLIYAGRTGTGFNQKTHALLRDKLEALKQTATAFDKPPAEARKGAIWVEPTLVAQVRFATWTADNLVRQAAFLGLREDKPAREVTRETSAPTPKAARAPTQRGVPRPSSARAGATPARVPPSSTASPSTTGETKRSVAAAPLEHPPIRLTHPSKILDPETNLTKQQLADYYWAVAPRMLPHVTGRPLSLVRCPEGASNPCFFQKHVNHMLPKGIGSVPVADKKGVVEPYITLNDAAHNREALASLAQMGVLEVHPWGSRNQDLEHPDRLIFDLDPDESLPWSTVAEAALEVRARLKKLGLASFLKTTGGKGLHIVIPIQTSAEGDPATPPGKSGAAADRTPADALYPAWPEAKEWAHRFVLAMEKANPRLYLTKMTKAARTGRIYLDYLRNERGATAVAPYSPRARSGAAVSMPLAWPEITRTGKNPGPYASARPIFPVAEFPQWQDRLRPARDPWKDMASTHQSLPRTP
ncbi:MAG: DNA ligase D [Acidobacteriota bacterium]|nr:DNA ligase D [Acidobacteriota bacterium]